MERVPVMKTLGSDKIHLYELLATKLGKILLEELKDAKNWHKVLFRVALETQFRAGYISRDNPLLKDLPGATLRLL